MLSYRKILERVIGVVLIILSIVIVVLLFPSLIPLLKKTPLTILNPDVGIRYHFWNQWLLNGIGLIIAFFLFRWGKAFIRDSRKN